MANSFYTGDPNMPKDPLDPKFHDWLIEHLKKFGYTEHEFDVIEFIETQIKLSIMSLDFEKRREITKMMYNAETKDEKLEVFKKLGFGEMANYFLSMDPKEYYKTRREWIFDNFDAFKAGVEKIDKEFDERLEKLSQNKK